MLEDIPISLAKLPTNREIFKLREEYCNYDVRQPSKSLLYYLDLSWIEFANQHDRRVKLGNCRVRNPDKIEFERSSIHYKGVMAELKASLMLAKSYYPTMTPEKEKINEEMVEKYLKMENEKKYFFNDNKSVSNCNVYSVPKDNESKDLMMSMLSTQESPPNTVCNEEKEESDDKEDEKKSGKHKP